LNIALAYKLCVKRIEISAGALFSCQQVELLRRNQRTSPRLFAELHFCLRPGAFFFKQKNRQAVQAQGGLKTINCYAK
jgi:hypothetical protein